MRLLVTDAAAQPPRQATAWLIMTFGNKMNAPKKLPDELLKRIEEAVSSQKNNIPEKTKDPTAPTPPTTLNLVPLPEHKPLSRSDKAFLDYIDKSGVTTYRPKYTAKVNHADKVERNEYAPPSENFAFAILPISLAYIFLLIVASFVCGLRDAEYGNAVGLISLIALPGHLAFKAGTLRRIADMQGLFSACGYVIVLFIGAMIPNSIAFVLGLGIQNLLN